MYSDEERLAVMNRICERIAMGEPLTAICRESGTPDLMTVYGWMQRYPDMEKMMAVARIFQADACADEMLEIKVKVMKCYDSRQAASFKVAADILRWQAQVRAPRKYGELVRNEVKVDEVSRPADVLEEVRELEKRLGIKFSGVIHGGGVKEIGHDD
jgi:hypothetical protein